MTGQRETQEQRDADEAKKLKARFPYIPAPYNPQVTAAVKAMEAGQASGAQQQLFLHWLVHNVSGAYDLSYRPGGEDGRRDSDFAEGKRFVGMQVVKQLRLPTKENG
jgi:hypothetical protein